jgi:hypothetical protein
VATYAKHNSGVVDMAAIENSHAMVTAGQDGSLHVWRVDLASSTTTNNNNTNNKNDAFVYTNNVNSSNSNLDNNNFVYSSNNNRDEKNNNINISSNSAATTTTPVGLSVQGATVVKKLDTSVEGAVLNVLHFNSDICSLVMYATAKGGLHAWDLRASQEAFQHRLRPELGFPTSMEVSSDRNWFCLGFLFFYNCLKKNIYIFLTNKW